jgi:hypothetical protein
LQSRLPKDRIARRKGDGSLDLDLQACRLASLTVMGADDDVIEWKPFITPLEFKAINVGAGKPSRFRLRQHRQEIVRTDLAFESSPGWAGRSGIGTAQKSLREL